MKTSKQKSHQYHSHTTILSKPPSATTVITFSADPSTQRSIGSSLTKRQRTEAACDICRRRKVRCVRQQDAIACKQCIQAKTECTVTPRPRGRKLRSVSILEEKVARMEQLLAQRLQQQRLQPEEKDTTEQVDHQQQQQQQQQQNDTNRWKNIRTRLLNMEQARPEEPINGITGWIYRMCGIDKATSDGLVKIYFDHVDHVFPVVNKTTFMQQYRGQMEPLPSPPLLCAIYSASVWYIECHRAFHNGATPLGVSGQQRTAEAWSRQHMHYIKQNQLPCLSVIQSLVISIPYRCGANSKWTDVWLLNSMAIRMAQDIGLHKYDQSSSLSENDKETRRHLWNLLYIMDRWLSAGTGRPLAAFDEDCEQVYSGPMNLETLHQQQLMTPLYDTISTTDYFFKPPSFEAITQIAKLSTILSRIIHGIYSPKAKKQCMENGSANLVTLLKSDLGAWRRNLPHFLEVAIVNDSTSNQVPSAGADESVIVLSGILGLCYYTSLILLYRPFIETTPTPSSQLLLKICTNSAIQLVDLFVKLQYKNHLLVTWSFGIYPMFVASLIHLYNAKSPNSIVSDVARANLLRILTILQTFGKLSPLAEQLHIALHCVAEQQHYLPSYGGTDSTNRTSSSSSDTISQQHDDSTNIIGWLDNMCAPLSNTDHFGLYSLEGLSCPYHLPALSTCPYTTQLTLPSLSQQMI
ncbi:fungal-specific transcription factor domain-containing protein [Chlamydoabsidia padenii]|nr:fungal-specific transcription factor domain-containing protein [Chlamydoabsidia padenii]